MTISSGFNASQPLRSLSSQTPLATVRPTSTSTPNGAPTNTRVEASITDVPFDGFLKYKNYDVGVTTDGVTQNFKGGFVYGPGHHIAAIAAMVFDEQLNPHPILKTGDTRLSRANRDKPYVQDGFVAGRMDHAGASSSQIALSELAEEVGGEVVSGTFRPLGTAVSPTMPNESTESDAYFVAAVKISGNPYGDGGSMEVTDLIGPKIMTPLDAIAATDRGEVSESSRTRTLFGRGFDSIGFAPQLGAYVHDHPQLAAKFDTLGLGEVIDIRGQLQPSEIPLPRPRAETLEAMVNDVVTSSRKDVTVSSGSLMVDARTHHAVNKNGVITALEGEFKNQYLHLDYDRAKVGSYYIDAERGPMLAMTTQARPALAFAPWSPKVMRRDVADIKISRDQDISGQLPEGARSLGSPSGASAGQSDLYYHFLAQEVAPPTAETAGDYVSLGEALTLCRQGDGDAQTEALCERLADDLGWIPNLGMSVDQARALMGK